METKEEWGVPQGKGYRISITLWTTFIGTEAEALEKGQDDADEFDDSGYVATCDGIEEIEISYPEEQS